MAKKAKTATAAAMDGLGDAVLALSRALAAVERIGGEDADSAAEVLRLNARIMVKNIDALAHRAGIQLGHAGAVLFTMSRVKPPRRAAA